MHGPSPISSFNWVTAWFRLAVMNCIVTAGPTSEPLDEVRRLTNFSTGRLGSEFANFLTAAGHAVPLQIGAQATWSGERQGRQVETFTTTESLRERLCALFSPAVEAVFHAAAVSDFSFGKIWQRSPKSELTELKAGKIPSRIEGLLVELVPAPKVIAHLRDWVPRACLVGWKFAIDGDRAGAVVQAESQIPENRTNACVANGRAYGNGFGLVTGPGRHKHLDDLEGLFKALEELALKSSPES